MDRRFETNQGLEPTDDARRIHQWAKEHCPDEPVFWHAQATIAKALKMSRDRVKRGCILLRRIGWLRIIGKRLSPLSGWACNVYEIADWGTPISTLAMRRHTRTAHTSSVSGHGRCRCKHCRPDQPRRPRSPRHFRPWLTADQWTEARGRLFVSFIDRRLDPDVAWEMVDRALG